MKANRRVNPFITDYEVETVVLIRQQYEVAKKLMEQVKAELEQLEQNLIQDLDLGTPTRFELYAVDIREHLRRFPSWKEHFIDLAGKEAADDVLAATEPKLYRSLLIKSA